MMRNSTSKKEKKSSHLDSFGRVRMVDISEKRQTERFARASAFISMNYSTISALLNTSFSSNPKKELKKGDALTTAKIAGILAAKKVSELIPLAHPIPITHCDIQFEVIKNRGIKISSTVKTKYETGVEMEALTAVSVAALTIYDMVKSIERDVVIERIQLEEKSGGKSGRFKR